MKKLSITGLFAILVALVVFFATGCTTKEVKYIPATTAPTTTELVTTTTEAPQKLSIDMAIAAAKESAPGLWIYTDSEMIQLMQTACDSLDDWNGDYDAFLQNAQTQMSGESSSLVQETSALVSAATFSLCTEHQVGLLDALDRATS
jgi:hypothetical protein